MTSAVLSSRSDPLASIAAHQTRETRMMNRLAQIHLLAALALAATFAPTQPKAAAANLYWDGTGTGWNSATSWSTSTNAATPDPVAAPTSADVAVFSTTTVISSQTVSLNAAQTALGLVFNAAAAT